MFVWIDPPGVDPGWIHELDSDEQIPAALAQHPIPADNDERRAAYDATHEGISAERYQLGRDFWGITVLHELPTDLPEGIVMVAAERSGS